MDATFWRLDDSSARLESEFLSTTIDLLRPSTGLHDIRLVGGSLKNLQLLGVCSESPGVPARRTIEDCYVRGRDLVVTYADFPLEDVRTQIYWRVVSTPGAEDAIAGVEMILSVQTELLDIRPVISTCSTLSAEEILRLIDRPEPTYRPAEVPCSATPDDGAGLLLFRLPEGDFSYAEMICASDFAGAELSRSKASSTSPVTLSFRLFEQRLEKGVIRRARLLSLFLPREGDKERAAATYGKLAAESPPLTV